MTDTHDENLSNTNDDQKLELGEQKTYSFEIMDFDA